MCKLALQSKYYPNITTLSNEFIDRYMPRANGTYVKIYIYLLRVMYSDKELSISYIAELFDETEKDILRALKYWEGKQLLSLSFNEANELTKIVFLPILPLNADMNSEESSLIFTAPPSISNSAKQILDMPVLTSQLKKSEQVSSSIVSIHAAEETAIGIQEQAENFSAFDNLEELENSKFQNSRIENVKFVNSKIENSKNENNRLENNTLINSISDNTKDSNDRESIRNINNKAGNSKDSNNNESFKNINSKTRNSKDINDSESFKNINSKAENSKDSNNSISFKNINNKAENTKFINSQVEKNEIGSKEVSEIFHKPNYSDIQINQLTEIDEVKWLLTCVERYLSQPLTQAHLQLILYLYESVGFSAELILYLYDYCVSKNIKSTSYIEKVAVSWAEDGIDTIEKAESTIALYTADFKIINKALGLNRAPCDTDRYYMKRWFHTFGFSPEIVQEACNRTISNTGGPSFKYADGILENWKKNNVTSLSDITKADQEHAKTVVQQKSIPIRTNTSFEQPVKPSANNKFNSFPQRQYTKKDFDDLERRLLNKRKETS